MRWPRIVFGDRITLPEAAPAVASVASVAPVAPVADAQASVDVSAALAEASTVTEVRRELRQLAMAQRRSNRMYQAAKADRLTAGLPVASVTPYRIVRSTLRALRARSRYSAANDTYARRTIELLEVNVVGPQGAVLQAAITEPSGKQDAAANSAIESAWAAWGEIGSADSTGTLSWVDLQRLFLRSVVMDGEWLHRWVFGPDAGPQGFCLQVIDPELLDVAYDRDLGGGQVIRCGVEFDGRERPVAYHLIDQRLADDSGSYRYQGRRYLRIPADEIVHRFWPVWLKQIRGLPWLSTAMLRLAHINGMEEAALIAAEVGAKKIGFFKRTEGGGFTGDGQTADGNQIMDVQAGSFTELDPGLDIAEWNPPFPDAAVEPFLKKALRGVASGASVPYESLANDRENVNYSSLRGGLTEARDLYKAFQEWYIGGFCWSVYRKWLDVQLLSGRILGADGKPLPALRVDRYRQVRWQPKRWEAVDMQKEATGLLSMHSAGAMSLTEICAHRGRSFDDVVAEIKADRELMREAGIEPKTAPPQAPAAPSKDDADQEEKDG